MLFQRSNSLYKVWAVNLNTFSVTTKTHFGLDKVFSVLHSKYNLLYRKKGSNPNKFIISIGRYSVDIQS